MKRRDFIAGGCAVPLVAGAGLAVAKPVTMEINVTGVETVKELIQDMYWENQWMIGEYEQELSELRTHAKIMSKRA